MTHPARPRVALFVTCLADLYRPTVGFAALRLLQQAGCEVVVPKAQTCCGQPAYNTGDRASATEIARGVVAAFAGFDYLVAPSGSCAGMLRHHLPSLFENDPNLKQAAETLGARTYELVSFLTDVMGMTVPPGAWQGSITYHDSCSGLRELGVAAQPRKLLGSVEGLRLAPLKDADVCCGFGGTFAVKYGEISDAIVARKTADIIDSGAPTLLAGDLGCLMNMAGKLQRQGSAVKVRHVAEVLAGMVDEPPIGAPATSGARR